LAVSKSLSEFQFSLSVCCSCSAFTRAKIAAHAPLVVFLDHLRGRAAALGDRFDALYRGKRKLIYVWRAGKIPLSDPASYRELLN
jgi:hypothetical protein